MLSIGSAFTLGVGGGVQSATEAGGGPFAERKFLGCALAALSVCTGGGVWPPLCEFQEGFRGGLCPGFFPAGPQFGQRIAGCPLARRPSWLPRQPPMGLAIPG